MYEPQEDSYLLKNCASAWSEKNKIERAVDMCTGTGIVAAHLHAQTVLGVDIDEHALAQAKERHPQSTVKWIQSNLFSRVEGSFDLITCNPPYLPNELHDPDIALDGGEKGHEFICAFLEQAKEHLSPQGSILLLFSSRSNPDAIFAHLTTLSLHGEKIAQEHFFFEDLWVYAITHEEINFSL